MVMPSKCPFCGETIRDGEELPHSCGYFDEEARKAWEKTLIGQGQAAGQALREFAEAINKEAKKSYENLKRITKDWPRKDK